MRCIISTGVFCMFPNKVYTSCACRLIGELCRDMFENPLKSQIDNGRPGFFFESMLRRDGGNALSCGEASPVARRDGTTITMYTVPPQTTTSPTPSQLMVLEWKKDGVVAKEGRAKVSWYSRLKNTRCLSSVTDIGERPWLRLMHWAFFRRNGCIDGSREQGLLCHEPDLSRTTTQETLENTNQVRIGAGDRTTSLRQMGS